MRCFLFTKPRGVCPGFCYIACRWAPFNTLFYEKKAVDFVFRGTGGAGKCGGVSAVQRFKYKESAVCKTIFGAFPLEGENRVELGK